VLINAETSKGVFSQCNFVDVGMQRQEETFKENAFFQCWWGNKSQPKVPPLTNTEHP